LEKKGKLNMKTNELKTVLSLKVPKKLPPAISQNVLVSPIPEGLQITATELEIFLSLQFPEKISRSFLLPRDLLKSAISSSKTLTFRQDGEKTEIVLDSGVTLPVPAGDPMEFPPVPDILPEEVGDVPLNPIRRCLISTGDEQIIFSGICFCQGNVISTDARRMTVAPIGAIPLLDDCIVPVVIPAKVFELFGKKVEKVFARCDHKGPNKFSFSAGNLTVVSRIIEARFPDYTRVIPKDCSVKVTFDLKEMIRAIEALKPVWKTTDDMLFLEFPGKRVFSLRKTDEGRSEPVHFQVPSMIVTPQDENHCEGIAFNAEYLLEFLETCDGNVLLSVFKPFYPGVFQDGEVKHVLIPMTY
jgi:DNA polymerase III sliding clamp (beta) subunit (PCNA family)